jgi:hypothetical protein
VRPVVLGCQKPCEYAIKARLITDIQLEFVFPEIRAVSLFWASFDRWDDGAGDS